MVNVALRSDIICYCKVIIIAFDLSYCSVYPHRCGFIEFNKYINAYTKMFVFLYVLNINQPFIVYLSIFSKFKKNLAIFFFCFKDVSNIVTLIFI